MSVNSWHPLISKNDEWASFETAAPSRYPSNEMKNIKGSYVRNAYLRGLAIEEKGIVNPYKFGLIVKSFHQKRCLRFVG